VLTSCYEVASHTEDYHKDGLRLSQDPSTPQDTIASYAVESGLSSAAHAPASPMGAEGPVSRDSRVLSKVSSVSGDGSFPGLLLTVRRHILHPLSTEKPSFPLLAVQQK
jgi:hypothetical protein